MRKTIVILALVALPALLLALTVTPFEMVSPEENQQGPFSPQAWYAEDDGTEITKVILLCEIVDATYNAKVYADSLGPRTFAPYDTFLATFSETNLANGDYVIVFYAISGWDGVTLSDPPLYATFYFTGIEEAPVSDEFGLNVLTPAPTGSTALEFSLGHSTEVTLKVYDALGNAVAVLVSGTVSKGRHGVTWDTSDTAPGVYFVRLSSEWMTETRKAIVLR